MKSKDTLVEGRFVLVCPLGKGAKAEVWKAVDRQEGGKAVALKCCGEESWAIAEYNNGLSFSHECLLKPTGLFGALIAMPFYEGRALDGICGYLTEEKAWQVLRDVASALAYLHERGICHDAVSLDNILWSGERFILSGLGHCHAGCSTPGDVWALAASVFRMVMGRPVFGGVEGRTQRPDSPLPFMRKSMPELSRLIARCLEYRPEKRPTAQEIRETAAAQAAALSSREYTRPLKSKETATVMDSRFWPDEMKEIV